MSERVRDALLALLDEVLGVLRARVGTHWASVEGTVHPRAGEIPLWVLIYDDVDIHTAHDALRTLVAPYFPRAGRGGFSVAYYRAEGGDLLLLDSLYGNEEIAAGHGLGLGFGDDAPVRAERRGAFLGASSARR